MHVTPSTVLLTVFSFLILILGCGKSGEEKQREAWEKAFKAVGEAIEESAGSADPGFTLSEVTHMDGRTVCWEITNRRDDPVTVHRVVFNGEWEAPVAGAGSWMPTGFKGVIVTYPQTLTIGGSCEIFHKSMYAKHRSYRKQIIYIDVYTDRGNFRYRPFEGFEPLKD